MKYNKINKLNIQSNISHNISYISNYNDQLLLIFLFKHLINNYNIILSRYISLNEINSIKYLFYEDKKYFDDYTKDLTNNVIFLHKRILIYDYISPLFIYYYCFYKKYIFHKKYLLDKFKKINIFEISVTLGLFESCLFTYYNDNNTNINYYKLQYYDINDNNKKIVNNVNISIDKIKNIYKDLKNYEINENYINTNFNINNIHKIIHYYKNLNINICNLDHISIRLSFNNKSIPMIFNHFIQIYIMLNILEEDGICVLTLDYEHYDYYLNIFYILNSLFNLKYPKFIPDRRQLVILENYDKNRFINDYSNIFNNILLSFNDLFNKEDYTKITNIFDIQIDEEYKIFFRKMYNKYSNEKKIKKTEKKLNKICNIEEVIKTNNKCFYFNDFLNLIKILYDKNYLKNINFCKKFDLDIKPDIIKDYNKIISKLKQQLYTMNYDNMYIIENQNNNNRIKLNTNNNDNYKNYIDYIDDLSNKLKLMKFYIDSRDIKKWNEITTEINIRKAITNYLDKNYDIKNSRAFVKMYDILNLVNVIDFNKNEINTLHVCEAPGNFINAINYFIKLNKPEMKYNWNANSLKPIKGTKIFGDFFGFIRKYPNRWNWLKDDSGDITKLDNILYIKNKLKNIELYTSDCGTECNTVEEMLDQENKMILVTFSQILIGLMVNKIGGHMIIKLFLPITKPLSYSLLYLLHNYYEKLYFIKQSSGSLGSSEFYIVGYNKLKHLEEDDEKELLKIYLLKEKSSNYTLYETLPEYFISKLNNITELFIKEQKKYIKRSFIYYDNKDIYEDHKIKYIKEAKELYCKEWITKNNFKILDNKLKL
jgi:cap2 methyltransferase